MNHGEDVKKALEMAAHPGLFEALVDKIKRSVALLGRKPCIMEVCGTHTWAISRSGIRNLLDGFVELISGPGCPVCVTAHEDIGVATALSKTPGTVVATYGDMIRVPGPGGSLEQSRAEGGRVITVYSAMDALEFAREHPELEVVFVAVGFETTAPGTAVTIKRALADRVPNFTVLSLHKVMPPAIRAILARKPVRVDALILPGHVSTITGWRYFDFIGSEFSVPAVVAGFEPCDVLFAILRLTDKLVRGDGSVENGYLRAVTDSGNENAQTIMYQVFERCRSVWRGLGDLPESGLRVRTEFKQFDAALRFDIDPPEYVEMPGCECGQVLSGVKKPPDCMLFGTGCTPQHPVGPCMVSSEGACRAHYVFSR